MLEAIAATYNGTNFVMEKDVQFEKGQQVIITFSRRATNNAQGQSDRKGEAFARLERMRKHIPDFDYKKELAEYRRERFGYADIG